MTLNKSLLISVLLPALFLISQCKSENQESTVLAIIESAASDADSPFYVNKKLYNENQVSLPIGVFDSGTGGLAVLEAILTLDEFNNKTHQPGSDNIPDFISEKFIYLADEANMPYGRYDAEGKAEFLRELVVKDVLFLVGTKYFLSPDDPHPQTDKEAVKEIIIACNTATAFGLETVKNAVKHWDIPVKITGIIEAGANTALKEINKMNLEKPLVAVFATEGTCSSGGYPRTIMLQAGIQDPSLDLQVLQQAGIGLAGAIDGDENYIDPLASAVRSENSYFGPGLSNPDYPLDLNNFDDYNFAGNNELLIETNTEGDTSIVQLNSVRNYVRYMVTGMVRNALDKFPDRTIDIAILGCTHYPYVENEIREHFSYLLKNPDYSNILPDSLVLIDPSRSLASTLYTNLLNNNLLAGNSMDDSEFYISVPNTLLSENTIDENMEFPFKWKYGRNENSGLQFVKLVPFSDSVIDPEIKKRIKTKLPATYKIMK